MKIPNRKHSFQRVFTGLAVAGILAWTSSAQAQLASPVDLYVMQVGDGGAWGTQGGTISLVKLTTDGTFDGTEFQDIFVAPSSGPNSIVLPVQGSSIGQLLVSGNGKYITFAGNGANAGDPLSTLQTAEKVVGVFDIASGTFDTSTRLSNTGNYQDSADVRAAYTIDGSGFWLGGQGSPSSTRSIRYVAAGGTSSVNVPGSTANVRNMTVYNGTLYFSHRDSGVYAVLPNNPGETLADLTTASSATQQQLPGSVGTAQQEGIALIDNFLFMAYDGSNNTSQTQGIRVLQFDAESNYWNQVALATVGVVSHLSLYQDSNGIHVFYTFASTEANPVNYVKFDPNTFTFGDATQIFTTSPGYVFKGVAVYAPIPEPSVVALVVTGLLAGIAGRYIRKKHAA